MCEKQRTTSKYTGVSPGAKIKRRDKETRQKKRGGDPERNMHLEEAQEEF